MSAPTSIFYRVSRWILRAGLAFYFTRIERFHPERIPATGPVLFTSNHPNSLTDAFVIGASVPRKVNFVATISLFGSRPIAWVLKHCGVIAINRVKDDPRAMRSVLKTFEACFSVLEQGEAVGIFPEGITHDDPQLKTIKTGAARMALELEQRHSGELFLQVIPVGLNFSSKHIYRSKALVCFGEPLVVAAFLPTYTEDRHRGIQALTAEIEQRIQGLMYHLPHLERARIVEAIKRLYLDRLWIANTVIQEPVTPQAGELLLTQAVADAVDRTFDQNPARAVEFVHKLDRYEATLRRLRLSDEVLAHFPARTWILRQSLLTIIIAIVGAPIALYGWLHRLVPYAAVQYIVRKWSKTFADRAHVSTATILSGTVIFTLFYGLCVLVFHHFFGLRATLWYAISLPPASLLAHYYLRKMRRFAASFRAAAVLLQAPRAARKLLAWRTELIALIEAERQDYLRAKASQNAFSK